MSERHQDRTLVVVPTFQERENLPRLVPVILEQDPSLDVLVVDDSSPDGTGEVGDGLAARSSGRVFVLHREGKGGLGPAYIAGFRWALERGYGRVCQMDADLSHPATALPTFLRRSEEPGVDFVIGSRYVGGNVTVVNWPVTRLLVSIFGNLYARVITRLPATDATGGFNLFHRRILDALELDRIHSTGYTFQIELKLRAWRRGFRFVEVPIIFTERSQGESKMSKRIVLEAVWKVWQLRLLDLTGRL
ncbi:MAG: polyprenol monophosphomannose synthase [Gemmatimonadetes bacterium]|nr:polyprenol monophosphomannose synthase [Gemmatimonadota bacterium]